MFILNQAMFILLAALISKLWLAVITTAALTAFGFLPRLYGTSYEFTRIHALAQQKALQVNSAVLFLNMVIWAGYLGNCRKKYRT
ncbi:hypothetical protein [Metabacillus idriensis]|uniref:hypothetical protein n=1 Tax=Metabacillus idriensis TaxID=324768 RepID=UPI00174ABAE1|nr:hypothetical protein [Metabacillus idriensis]